MKNYRISTKIKILGLMLIGTIFAVILSTIYLNQKNMKDSLTINIAGKQRMLTQRITKNIYYANQFGSRDFVELDKAVKEFEYGLSTLSNGNKLLGIYPAPTDEIKVQLSKITTLWSSFKENIDTFKSSILTLHNNQQIATMNYIVQTNNELLNEVDKVVTLLTRHHESKREFLEKFQYIAMAFLLYLALYSIIQLREIEMHIQEFMNQSKELTHYDNGKLKPLEVEGEKEIIEVASSINSFISKVNDAMAYSSQAIQQSQNASKKLEELSDEFDTIIGEIQHSSSLSHELDKSEDIVLDSTESLIKTTKKLQNLKNQLDSLMICYQKMK
ncbi:MAG: type IV pili methyl-accepting chemotaxis transducer N-terminal domain-containing protein [Campylobacterales bacterium]|nr:type IV pili methyl-accepting chemotaxis transducer N-terminal domain-containing protein [Campylobacterales bacterium]